MLSFALAHTPEDGQLAKNMMETAGFSETSLQMFQTTRHVPADGLCLSHVVEAQRYRPEGRGFISQ
jgi:hypothetical protein